MIIDLFSDSIALNKKRQIDVTLEKVPLLGLASCNFSFFTCSRERLSIGCSQLVQLEDAVKQFYESVGLEAKNRGWL